MEPYSSEWWLDRLGKELDARERDAARFEDYYHGRHPFPLAGQKFRDAFRGIFAGFSDNFCRLVIQATEERLTVTGFRFGGPRADRLAWGLWQANSLDSQSQRLHREALLKGEALAIVGPSPVNPTVPVIRVQEPEHVVIGYGDDALDPLVAMKRWRDEARDLEYATLYYPDRLEKYERRKAFQGWAKRAVPGEPWPLPHALGAVPVVSFPNDPDIDARGSSEIEGVIPLQNAINKELLDMLVASEFGAFRQRWVSGIEIPIDPVSGAPVEPYKAAIDRLWIAEDKDARFGEFGQTDLTPYVKAVETLVQHIASTTRTPPHYLLGQMGAFPSGEALRSTESGLVAKARRRMRDFGESWEHVMRLALRVAGSGNAADYTDAETIWADPEVRTESEHVDAVLKRASAGVPRVQLWEDLGYSPQLIAAWREQGLDRVPDNTPAADVPAAV